ncbi:PP0621 family protein [Halomonas vilamensis]|uniref:PP0621 family protein n=1 Tax=Vreelandella vilamensis TaxID=531309 RepID=A0ABU1H504_9GAMM|nr:PP0621 family protein [Halomonas vilamensis]MDR5899378.1 PP0621 family protein [Halomonas vilamensis]
MNLLIIRLIIFAVLFFAGLKLYGMYREWKLDREALEQKPERRDGGQMVRCQWCDVHVPEEDALREQNQWFCSSAHRDRFLQKQRDAAPEENQETHEDSDKRD